MSAKIKIINNKKLSMTDEEYKLYNDICRSYDRANFKGEDLFKNLFESDKDGIITMIKPPTQQTSFEVYLFIVGLYQHQHKRLIDIAFEKKMLDLEEKYDKKFNDLINKYEKQLGDIIK